MPGLRLIFFPCFMVDDWRREDRSNKRNWALGDFLFIGFLWE